MSNESHDRGMKTRRKVLGDEWVDLALKNTTAFNAEFQDLITRYAWNEIWNRPRFSHKERRLIVIGTMVALAARRATSSGWRWRSRKWPASISSRLSGALAMACIRSGAVATVARRGQTNCAKTS